MHKLINDFFISDDNKIEKLRFNVELKKNCLRKWLLDAFKKIKKNLSPYNLLRFFLLSVCYNDINLLPV